MYDVEPIAIEQDVSVVSTEASNTESLNIEPIHSLPKSDFNSSKQKLKASIRLFSINVGGLSTKYDLGILDLKVRNYDIICLTETKTQCIENFVFNGFKAIAMPAKSLNTKYCGFHGICIYVREEIFDDIEIVCDLSVSESIMWFIVNVKYVGYKFLAGVAYIPHEGSKYYSNDLFDNIIFDLAKFRSCYGESMPILMLGDFNARTGLVSDFIEVDESDSDILGLKNDSMFAEVFDQFGIPINRENKDVIVNDNGKNLIEMCKVTDLKILNGRIGENTSDFTCHTGMGKSAIDYLITSKETIPLISDFKIDSFERALSDAHCGLSVTLRGESRSRINNNDINNPKENCNYLTFDLKWDQNKRDDFFKNFDLETIHELNDTLSSIEVNNATKIEIESVTEKLKSIFIQSATKTGLRKEIAKNRRFKNIAVNAHKPWFDENCKSARTQYLKFKNKMQKIKTPDSKIAIKEKLKSYTNIIKQSKSYYQEKLHKDLRKSRKSQPKVFWDIINGMKNKSNENVTLESFREHFAKLGSNDETVQDGVQIRDFNGDVYDENINEPFTLNEIKSQIKILKNNKACGFDRIINEYLKNCPNEVLEIIVKYFNVILDTGIIPNDWSIALIHPIFKNKGSQNDPNNYRGISLLSCISKLFTSCLNHRLFEFLEGQNLLKESQVGFRRGYSSNDHVFRSGASL